MPDYSDTARRAIEDQLSRLREEVGRLEQAASVLRGQPAPRSPGRPRRRAAKKGRRTASGPAASTGRRLTAAKGRRRGRPRGSGGRSAQALKLVSENPGIKVSELAKKMGIGPNYLYRLLPGLQAEGKVKKQDGGWHPTS